MDAAEFVAFGHRLAKPQVYLQGNYHHPEHPEIFVSANGPIEGRKMGVARTGYFWHADCTFEERPLAFTMLYPQVLPSGERSTYYLDMAKAFSGLPQNVKDHLMGAWARHDGNARYKIKEDDLGRPLHEILDEVVDLAPGAVHPAVIRHPFTNEDILFVSSGFTSRILGMSLDESWSLLKEVFANIEKEENICQHEWDEGHIAIWDNRALLHRSGKVPQGQTSAMFRIGLYDDYPLSTRVPSDAAKPQSLEMYAC